LTNKNLKAKAKKGYMMQKSTLAIAIIIAALLVMACEPRRQTSPAFTPEVPAAPAEEAQPEPQATDPALWDAGGAKEFAFSCNPGNRAEFTLVTIRTGTERQIMSTGWATPPNPSASIPGKCFFSPEFECVYTSFSPDSLRIRLKNMANTGAEVIYFVMKGANGEECLAN
jgi:hypothetical protein